MKRLFRLAVASRDELRLRLGQQQALAHLSQLALTDAPAQELLDEACRVAAAELCADLAAVLELLPDRGGFLLKAAVGWPQAQLGVWEVPAGPHSHSGYTLLSSGPVIMHDAGREKRFAVSPQMASQGVTSGVSTSIGSNGGTYGVLSAHTYLRRRFSEHDVTFLEGVANILSSALRRRAAEAEAEKAHRVLEAVIEGTTDDIFVKDLEGRVIAMNASAARRLGFPPEELIGHTLHELVPAPMADLMAETDRLILERGTVETFEERVPFGDETSVFLTTKGPYRARDGTLLGTFGIAHEITARTRQEQDLARSEERFRLAQEGARMGTWDVDLVTGVTTWSDGLRTLYGVDRDYPAGFENFLPLVHPDDREAVAQEVMHAYTHGVEFEFECRIVRPSGELCWILARTSAFRGEDGGLVRVLGVAVEITKLKEAEEQLRAAKEYADRLIETSNALVLVLDLDANIITFNKAAEELTGYTREEVLGRNWDVLLPRDRYPEPWAELARLCKGGLPERYENPILTKSGEERLIFWQNSELRDLGDAVVGTVSFGIDMTEAALAKEQSEQSEQALHELETRLRQAEKLEAIGQLAGGVAHDFNNLLVAIRGSGELALDRLERGGEQGIAGDLEDILVAADRGGGLTRQLLAFGRRQVLNPEVLDLNDVVRQTVRLLERVIGDNVQLETVLTESPVVVRADRGQLEQVITNLAINGRDSMPGGGLLTIRVDTAEPDSSGSRCQALLSVSDRGSGIDPSTATHIFEPFFTTKGKQGTGLGLATVHGIVAQSGGRVELDTEVGRGSTFTMYLPLCAEVPSRARTAQASASTGGSETVLLVEDDPTVRSIVSRMLGARGYDVLDAGGGEEAIHRFKTRERPIDLVLTDLMMNGIDGRQTIERIREIDPDARVLYMSGYSEDVTIRSGALRPATDFIQKPFTGDELATHVRELLGAARV